MDKIPHYRLQDIVKQTEHFCTYRAIREADKQVVLIKTVFPKHATPLAVAQLNHEYEMIQHLKGRNRIIASYTLIPFDRRLALVMENVEGILLHDLIKSQKIDVKRGLVIAIETAKAIRDIHRGNVIHKDIRPQNIMVAPLSNKITIIDFGLSTCLEREMISPKAIESIGAVLPHISPEQTGRINREITYRTDFYSFGMLLYELFTGGFPFASSDPREWIHFHITKKPTPPHLVDPGIPVMVSTIILKLLEKNSEDRYKSAAGILFDLEQCHSLYSDNKEIHTFPLGQQDYYESLFIPEKLYGREKQMEALFKHFDQTVKGKCQVVLVSGEAGIGKSVVIQEIQRPLTRIGGFFITGKCDQFKRNIFYNAIIEAFQQLLMQILAESPQTIAKWKNKILDAVGVNGQLIIDVIPITEKIIGKQQPLPKLPPKETRDRFHYYFQAFLQVFISKETPLVLFLDDLQWIDFASLELLKSLIADPVTKNLLVIGAYDEQQLGLDHPLLTAIEEMRRTSNDFVEMALHPLEEDDISQLLADTFGCQHEHIRDLALFIKEKTKGNPFFIKELLKTSVLQQTIFFSPRSQHWQWNLDQVKLIAPNVLDLLEEQMRTTDEETQQCLKIAAVLGNIFSLKTLSTIANKAMHKVAKIFRQSLERGWIVPVEEGYEFFSEYHEAYASLYDFEGIKLNFKFTHDCIRQAAYQLMSDEEKKEIHYQLGKELLATAPQDKIEESIFDITYHLNEVIDHVADPQDRLRYSQLDLLASIKAKNASSYHSAVAFAKKGLQWLNSEQKESEYTLWKDLSAQLAECYAHIGDFKQATQQFEETLGKVKSVEEKIHIFILWNRLYQMRGEYHQAIDTGYRGLALLNYPLPRKVHFLTIFIEFLKVRWFLFRHPPHVISSLPQVTNQRMLLITELLYSLLPPTFVVDERLTFFVGLRLMLTLKYGISPFSLLGISGASSAITWLTSRYKRGENLGELAVALCRKYDYRIVEPVALFVYAAFQADQHYPLQTGIAMLKEAYEKFLTYGDFMYAGYAVSVTCWQKLYAGEPIDQLFPEVQKALAFNKRVKNDLSTGVLKILNLYLLALQKENPKTFSNEEFDTASQYAAYRQKDDHYMSFRIALSEASVCFLFEDYSKAKEWIDSCKKLLIMRVNFQVWMHTHYLECLVLAGLYPSGNPLEKRKYLTTFRKNLRILKNWISDPTKNKCHFYYLAKGEYDRLIYPERNAIDYYLQAIKIAKENHFIQDVAIANELAAKYELEKGRENIAETFLKQAVLAYQQWGALGKVKQIEMRYPHLFPSEEEQTVISTQVRSGEVDLMSVIDASRVMTGELNVDQLLTRLMEIVVTTAGATKAFLFLIAEGKLSVVTEWDEDSQQAILLKSCSFEEKSDAFCQKIIFYVEKMKEPVVLRSAFEEGMYMHDPYIRSNRIRSVLCIPLMHENLLFGILYLENNLATDSFTKDRVEILQLLSSEIAVAIQNATLYTDLRATMHELKNYKNTLERMVDERTIELRKKKEELELTLQKLHTTQEQVVQQEKLAALGSFTQGVAHEIQNPLNFVNNFSEIIIDQFNEIAQELTKGEEKLDVQKIEGEIDTIYNMSRKIKENSERIKKIVDMMLEHGRIKQGEVSLVDVNALLHQASEIAYYDFSSKDPAFSITVEEHFDENLTKIEGVSKNLSRVFFNVLHNAFYAVFEKKKIVGVDFLPIVSVTTKEDDECIEITIRDNGPGIPENLIDEVFTQFFTTKPPGTGVGLGLSLSYDIIVHEHHGTIAIHSSTEEGYTEVYIKLLHHFAATPI